MIKDGIKASFVLGGITNSMCELLEEGLVEKVIDVQDFDHHQQFHLQTMQTTMKLTQACTQTHYLKVQ